MYRNFTLVLVLFLGIPAAANANLSSADRNYLKQRLGFNTDAVIYDEMSAAQVACVHSLISRPGSDTKRLKDLENYIGFLANKSIVGRVVSEVQKSCPK